MRIMLGLIAIAWPLIFGVFWVGMSGLGYSGWAMDLLFVATITATVLAAILVLLAISLFKD